MKEKLNIFKQKLESKLKSSDEKESKNEFMNSAMELAVGLGIKGNVAGAIASAIWPEEMSSGKDAASVEDPKSKEFEERKKTDYRPDSAAAAAYAMTRIGKKSPVEEFNYKAKLLAESRDEMKKIENIVGNKEIENMKKALKKYQNIAKEINKMK